MQHRDKIESKNEHCINELWGKFMQPDIHVFKIPGKERGIQKFFFEKNGWNVFKYGKKYKSKNSMNLKKTHKENYTMAHHNTISKNK